MAYTGIRLTASVDEVAASKDRDIFEVHYKCRRPLRERLASGIRAVVKGVSGERWQDRMLP